MTISELTEKIKQLESGQNFDEGTLRVHLLGAHLTHDTEIFGKMDPYIKMLSREQEWQSSVQKDAGKNPVWQKEYFDVDVHYHGDELRFQVFDEDITRDGNVGEGSTKLSALMRADGFDEWFLIQFKGEPAGKVHLRSEWVPKY